MKIFFPNVVEGGYDKYFQDDENWETEEIHREDMVFNQIIDGAIYGTVHVHDAYVQIEVYDHANDATQSLFLDKHEIGLLIEELQKVHQHLRDPQPGDDPRKEPDVVRSEEWYVDHFADRLEDEEE